MLVGPASADAWLARMRHEGWVIVHRDRISSKAALAVASVAFTAAMCGHAQTSAYTEPNRPQVHFSPQKNWTNDPNGLVYFQGEYHLFYQYNPFGDQWGHMSWGHAVSPDLLHWEELPVALPEADGVMIFTGSIVVDEHNTSGLCDAGKPCLVAVYTGHSDDGKGHVLQTQNLASSRDRGRTWTKFPGNPVLDLHMADFRDPSVTWDEQAKHWVMAVSLPKEHKVRFYRSPDLKAWTQLSDFGPMGDVAGDWECPDLLHVPAANGGAGTWALKVGLNPGGLQGGSGEQYFLGNFDGTRFQASKDPGAFGWTNYGKDDYCAISYNGLPKSQKPVLIGWMSNWQYAAKLPTSPWRGQMSLPRQLSVLHDAAGTALKQEPVTAPLRGSAHVLQVPSATCKTAPSPLNETALFTSDTPYEVQVTFQPGAQKNFSLRVYADKEHFLAVGFDRGRKEFYIDRTHSGLNISPDFPVRTVAPIMEGRPFDLRLIIDRFSAEAYAQGGTIAMTNLFFPPSQNQQIVAVSGNGEPAKLRGTWWPLRSAWKSR